jgi:hypothetical protein
MSERLEEWLEDLRENWDDPYWRADHPEVQALIVAVVTGLVGLAFAWFEILLQQRLT